MNKTMQRGIKNKKRNYLFQSQKKLFLEFILFKFSACKSRRLNWKKLINWNNMEEHFQFQLGTFIVFTVKTEKLNNKSMKTDEI